jgi:large subunit ribosomal protein L24
MKSKTKSPKKQRLANHVAPLHKKGKLFSVHLSKELRKKYNKRNIRARKGDKVKILRGNFKSKEGKIASVNLKKGKLFIEGVETIKKDGTKVQKSFRPSNLIITSLNEDDKKRKNKLQKENKESKK